MIVTHLIHSDSVDGSLFRSSVSIELPEPAMSSRSVTAKTIAPPRSATRIYQADELATAAAMLTKLRRREDLAHLAQGDLSTPMDQNQAMEVAVDRLLRVL